MRFVIRSAPTSASRRGALVEFARHPDTVVETPTCTLYTRGGSVPHLTPDVWERLTHLPSTVQMPMPTLYLGRKSLELAGPYLDADWQATVRVLNGHFRWVAGVEHQRAVSKHDKGIAAFSGMQDFVVFSAIQDSSAAVPAGYNDKNSVAVWGRSGKIKLEVDSYMTAQEAFRPDIYQALSDADNNKDTTRKRARKSVDRTINFLDSCLERHEKSEVLKNSAIFGAVEGGHHLAERQRSARETATRSVDGFSLEGFYNLGPEPENFEFTQIQDLIQQTLAELPPDKPRLLQGGWSPMSVLDAVSCGVDIFDSTYPYIVTEKGEAILFDFKYDDQHRTKTSELDSKFTINLKDKRYRDDFSAVCPSCHCYCCQTFTRAYINHLLNTSELLAAVLLMIHNFHQYFEFFHTIRRSLDDNRFEDLRRLVQNQTPTKTS